MAQIDFGHALGDHVYTIVYSVSPGPERICPNRPFDSLASCFDGAYELRFCTVRAAANCSPVRAR